ncbi:MAG: trypsin-like peptidase domain-containing protein [Patescibacteria group bacterium]|nr:trypsin-like peptidase domain-containing protein [Patescibacteria group bacterium]
MFNEFFNKYFKVPFIGLTVMAVLIAANAAVSQKFSLNGSQPSAAQGQAATDEQQAILAVRNAKSSVVSVVGFNPNQANNSAAASDGSGSSSDIVAGTGFVLSSDGYIASNNHVVQDPSLKYEVIMPDNTSYDAKVVGLDKFDDVAVLKINANNLAPAKLGDSDSLETGQTVFAIGNSLGKYQNTVTRGVVSGLGRSVSEGGDSSALPRIPNLIQTDAAINPGNSGGPLINMSGEVVGMDTMIDTGGQGLGFAIPINVVKAAAGQLKTGGQIRVPYAGLSFITIDTITKQLKGLPVGNGAYVDSVVSGGPADKAGIKAGDIVLEVNRQPLDQNHELDMTVRQYQPGNQVSMTILRDGQKQDVAVLLGEFK